MELLKVRDAAKQAGVTVKAIYYSIAAGKFTRRDKYGRALVGVDELANYRPRGRASVRPSPASDSHRIFAEATRHI
jgi:hypothetical protein